MGSNRMIRRSKSHAAWSYRGWKAKKLQLQKQVWCWKIISDITRLCWTCCNDKVVSPTPPSSTSLSENIPMDFKRSSDKNQGPENMWYFQQISSMTHTGQQHPPSLNLFDTSRGPLATLACSDFQGPDRWIAPSVARPVVVYRRPQTFLKICS